MEENKEARRKILQKRIKQTPAEDCLDQEGGMSA